jgi:hypothetical protein
VGDVGDMSRSTYEHHMLIAAGSVEVKEEGKPPWTIDAPGVLIVPTGVNITLEALVVPVIIYCIYNKLTAGSLDDVRGLVEEMRKQNLADTEINKKKKK